MTAPSYASAVLAAPAAAAAALDIAIQYEELYRPRPKSMTLIAALMLLDSPLTSPESRERWVFLMTREYLQNWLTWALNQPVSPDEEHRVRMALRLAIEAQGLTLSSSFHEPGPIDASKLSVDGHPLLLRPNVVVGSPQAMQSLENGSSLNKVCCCGVPERFYEVSYFGFRRVKFLFHSDYISSIFFYSSAPPVSSRRIVRRRTFCSVSS
jgi:hypothetical protein